MQKIIGLLGAKGAGKDTCAEVLTQRHGYQRIGFADLLYREVAYAFGATVAFLGNRETKESPLPQLCLNNCLDPNFVRCVIEELSLESLEKNGSLPLSPRVIMQIWGTEYRRRRGVDSYWLDEVRRVIRASPGQNFVVTDVRFLNEFNFIKTLGGLCVRVRRLALEALEAINRAKNGTAAHSSETELLLVTADAEIENTEGSMNGVNKGILALPASFLETAAT